MRQRLFSQLSAGRRAPASLFLHRREGVEAPMSRRGRRFWVVSRALCRHFAIPLLGDAAAAQQRDALELQIERLSPFAQTGSHIHFGGRMIGLWLWDQQGVAAATDALGLSLARVTVIPETALLPEGNGPRLIECLDGVEGQCWVDGELVASRWWPVPPDPTSWILLQRSASIGPAEMLSQPPAVVALDWLPRPWTRAPGGGWAGLGNIDYRVVAACIVVVFLGGYGYLAAEWIRLRLDIAGVEDEIAASAATIEPVMKARGTALANQAAISQLSQLDPYRSQLALMAQIANILPKNSTHFTEWTYDRGRLDLTIAAAQPLDAAYFVRALDRLSPFTQVSAERAGSDNSLRIRLTIEPK